MYEIKLSFRVGIVFHGKLLRIHFHFLRPTVDSTSEIIMLAGVNRCQYQRAKKRDRADEKAGVVLFTSPGGTTGTVVYRLDAKRSLPESLEL